MIVCGWIFWLKSFSASLNNSPANTQTEVVPSPTSSSCVLEISIKIRAAGLLTAIAFKIVAPSFVTSTFPFEPWLWRILSYIHVCKIVATRSRCDSTYHSLWSKCCLHKISQSHSSNHVAHLSHFSLFFIRIVLKNLNWSTLICHDYILVLDIWTRVYIIKWNEIGEPCIPLLSSQLMVDDDGYLLVVFVDLLWFQEFLLWRALQKILSLSFLSTDHCERMVTKIFFHLNMQSQPFWNEDIHSTI